MKNIHLALSSLLLLASVPVYSADAPIIAGGYYNNYSPMLVSYQQNQWVYGIDSQKTPEDNQAGTGIFEKIHCGANTCLASGIYDPNYSYFLNIPMMARSTDGGQTWDYVMERNKNLPADFNYDLLGGSFASIGSTADMLIAVGSYTSNSGDQKPLLSYSTDEGLSWNYSTQLPDDSTGRNQFRGVSCQDNTCIVVGTYGANNNDYPMILTISEDNWQYTLDSQQLPDDFHSTALFEDISCAQNVCVAVGQYYTENSLKPLLVVSHDNGATWDYQQIAQINALEKVSCTSTHCVTTGFDEKGKGYLATGTINNNEITWEIINSDDTYTHQLRSVSCSSEICIAGGENYTLHEASPILLISTDQGKTWDSIVSPDQNVPVDFNKNMRSYFKAVNCDGLTCTAVGIYNAEYDYPWQGKPMLLMTVDGKEWQYGIDATQNLPKDFSNSGEFNATEAKSSN